MYSVLLLVIPKVRMARTTQKDMEKHPRRRRQQTKKKRQNNTNTVLDMGKVLRCNASSSICSSHRPPSAAISGTGGARKRRVNSQPAKKKKKGFDQDQALYCTIHDKQDSSHTHTPSGGVRLANPEAVRTHVPKPCAQPLTDPLPKVGARCRGCA